MKKLFKDFYIAGGPAENRTLKINYRPLNTYLVFMGNGGRISPGGIRTLVFHNIQLIFNTFKLSYPTKYIKSVKCRVTLPVLCYSARRH